NELARQALLVGGLSPDQVTTAVTNQLSVVRDEPLKTTKGLTSETRLNFAQAGREAHQMGHNFLCSSHILLGVLERPSEFLENIFKELPKFDVVKIRAYVQANVEEPSGIFSKKWRPSTWEFADVFTGLGIPSNANTQARSMSSLRSASAPQGNRATATTTARPARPAPRRTATQPRTGLSTWQIGLIGLAFVIMVAYGAVIRPDATVPLVIVIGGWIVSLTLHEFAHALVAYFGGDHTVVEKGYLTMNPLKYTHPFLSIIFPLLILLAGGIGLPGGAVYIERHRLRSKWWGSAVSAAGPFANLICAIVFSAPFWLGLVTPEQLSERGNLWYPLAFLVFIQVTAIMFNLLPIPPLDGFGVIEPLLPEDMAMSLRSLGIITLVLILFLLRVPTNSTGSTLGREFYNQAATLTENFDIERDEMGEGLDQFYAIF
ncbi:hypothetical protein ANRL4_02616, partial [Anaerolineae bacterium]